MKETVVGALVSAVGFVGILFTSSSVFFGLISAGVFLVIYGSLVIAERESESSVHPTFEVETSIPASFCPNCGGELALGAVYCPKCGKKVR